MFDVTVIGAGILGTNLSFWISQKYAGNFNVVEMEPGVAHHTSQRNTGVIHRPFYLNPQRRKIFARCAQVSYLMWKEYAALHHLPWKEIRTIEVATEKKELEILEKYMSWALQNGMDSSEVELLSPSAVRAIEPNVDCVGALYSKTDTAVNYAQFTQKLQQDAQGQGVQFQFDHPLQNIEVKSGYLELTFRNGAPSIQTKFLVNCAGGNSIDVMHAMQVGMEYTDLHFRGEYWRAGEAKKGWVKTNIYSVPRHAELPFLDPHWIVRADGNCEIGPNAVLVSGYNTYHGFFNNPLELAAKIFEAPRINKLRLFSNREFLSLAAAEWKSSVSKSAMVRRVQKFIPNISAQDFVQRGVAGIRSSVIDRDGNFMKEAIELPGKMSYHVTNYNSPGATGAPAYTALLASKLENLGVFSGLKKQWSPTNSAGSSWNFERTVSKILEN